MLFTFLGAIVTNINALLHSDGTVKRTTLRSTYTILAGVDTPFTPFDAIAHTRLVLTSFYAIRASCDTGFTRFENAGFDSYY
ncbi:hypothetical protein [Algoriphagus resistens]|uniref:hypothetical protein n=1 Tax=Algoriphagus resistens TaxID=1750590 RepID=UPI000716B0F4|nr:hypothetical protein [Algoriphagus resistens]